MTNPVDSWAGMRFYLCYETRKHPFLNRVMKPNHPQRKIRGFLKPMAGFEWIDGGSCDNFEEMSVAVPAEICRVKMKGDTLPEMVAWLHAMVAAQRDRVRRHRGSPKARTRKPVDQHSRSEYQRRYRAKLKARLLEQRRRLDDGTVMRELDRSSKARLEAAFLRQVREDMRKGIL